jgi:DNA-binding response OmpR family regulator
MHRRKGRATLHETQSVPVMTLDHDTGTITIDGVAHVFTPRPWALLTVLAANPGRVFNRNELYELAWGEPSGVVIPGTERVVDTYICRIRKALGAVIETHCGRGYSLNATLESREQRVQRLRAELARAEQELDHAGA